MKPLLDISLRRNTFLTTIPFLQTHNTISTTVRGGAHLIKKIMMNI
jgi:hypothetical protein